MAGNYDPNKDYAAAIKNATSEAEKNQLKKERQNKIDAMNAAGTNTKGYTNDIYNNSGNTGNKTTGTTSGNKSTGNKNGSSGYYDPNFDYAAAIQKETDPVKKAQLMQERANKIAAMDAAGTNTGGYTNDIYKNNGGQTVSKDSFGYFDSGKDYAAEIARETDPIKKAQLVQERANKIAYLEATGQNKGYSNSIYGNGTPTSAVQEPVAKGIYQNQDAILNDATLGKMQMDAATNAALAGMNQNATMDLATVPAALMGTDYGQALTQTTDPVQQAALQAYFTRQLGTAAAEDTMGVYTGDESLSLPDQQKIKQLQALWNQGKATGNQALMDAAAKQAESIRDDYRYYPLANTDGYGLGENKLGYIRDIVVRVDSQGNKYVDEYGLNNVTTTMYRPDGTFVNRGQHKINSHDDYVARQMDRSAEYGNDWTAIRVANAEDAQLNTSELVAKYGAQPGMGRDLYGNARISSKIANGKTLADLQAEQGITGANGLNGMTANAGNALNSIYSVYGYFDPNFDYAAALQTETDPTRRAQLMQERDNKIAYLNGTGQNPNGYTNAIYGQTTQQVVPGTQQVVTPEMMMPEYVGQAQEELQAAYDKIAQLQEQAIQNQLSMTQAQINAAQQTANSEYDDLAREAYINMRLSQNALPQQLSALGISGGGSESANLKLQTNYQNNLHTSEQQRAQMLKDFALQGLQAQTQANSDIANINANAAQNALNAWLSEQANQNSWNQWLANFQMQQKQYQDSLSQYEYEKQQNELTQAIELAQLTGDYSRLKAMGYDTTYMEQLKDANLKQMALEALYTQAQTAKVNGSVKSGSGGGNSGGSGGAVNTGSELRITNQDNGAAIYVPGLRWVSYAELDKLVEAGTVKEVVDGSKVTYKKVW
ncbi:hypothetical protein [Anaerotignum sp.]